MEGLMLEVFKKAKEINDMNKSRYVNVEYLGRFQLLSIVIWERNTFEELCSFETHLDRPDTQGSLEKIIKAFYDQIKELISDHQSQN